MFTGIIEDLGVVTTIKKQTKSTVLIVYALGKEYYFPFLLLGQGGVPESTRGRWLCNDGY